MQKGKCKLCLKEDVDLLTKSHIIPSFLFSDMKDFKNNSFIQLTPEKYIAGRNQHIKKIHDSFHESNILCKNCDNVILKKYEDYLKLTLHSTKKPNYSRPICVKKISEDRGFNVLYIENVNYKLYKLGFLSILWRASISNLSFFKIVDLGVHSELIRKILFEDIEPKESDYPFFTSFLNRKNDTNQIILPIIKFQMEKYTNYRFIINGLDIIFIVGGIELTPNLILLNQVPNLTGKLTVIEHKRNYGLDMFLSHIKQLKFSSPKY